MCAFFVIYACALLNYVDETRGSCLYRIKLKIHAHSGRRTDNDLCAHLLAYIFKFIISHFFLSYSFLVNIIIVISHISLHNSRVSCLKFFFLLFSFNLSLLLILTDDDDDDSFILYKIFSSEIIFSFYFYFILWKILKNTHQIILFSDFIFSISLRLSNWTNLTNRDFRSNKITSGVTWKIIWYQILNNFI